MSALHPCFGEVSFKGLMPSTLPETQTSQLKTGTEATSLLLPPRGKWSMYYQLSVRKTIQGIV